LRSCKNWFNTKYNFFLFFGISPILKYDFTDYFLGFHRLFKIDYTDRYKITPIEII